MEFIFKPPSEVDQNAIKFWIRAIRVFVAPELKLPFKTQWAGIPGQFQHEGYMFAADLAIEDAPFLTLKHTRGGYFSVATSEWKLSSKSPKQRFPRVITGSRSAYDRDTLYFKMLWPNL